MTTGSLIDPAGVPPDASADPGGGVLLRPLGAADVPALAAAMAGLDPWQRLGYTSAALVRYWYRPDSGASRIGVRLRGDLVGGLCVRPRWLRGCFLELLCLLPTAQGQGIGGRIIDWLAAAAPDLGPNLWTSVSTANPRALAFYRRRGFAEAARLPELIAPAADELLLRRPLRDAPADAPR
jgi:GNAT superfamily N-acetyltransferase